MTVSEEMMDGLRREYIIKTLKKSGIDERIHALTVKTAICYICCCFGSILALSLAIVNGGPSYISEYMLVASCQVMICTFFASVLCIYALRRYRRSVGMAIPGTIDIDAALSSRAMIGSGVAGLLAISTVCIMLSFIYAEGVITRLGANGRSTPAVCFRMALVLTGITVAGHSIYRLVKTIADRGNLKDSLCTMVDATREVCDKSPLWTIDGVMFGDDKPVGESVWALLQSYNHLQSGTQPMTGTLIYHKSLRPRVVQFIGAHPDIDPTRLIHIQILGKGVPMNTVMEKISKINRESIRHPRHLNMADTIISVGAYTTAVAASQLIPCGGMIIILGLRSSTEACEAMKRFSHSISIWDVSEEDDFPPYSDDEFELNYDVYGQGNYLGRHYINYYHKQQTTEEAIIHGCFEKSDQ